MGNLAELNRALSANRPEQAKAQLSEIKKDWPSLKSKNALALQEHEGLVARVDYLVEHAPSVDVILESVYSSLLPVPGSSDQLILKTEVPQLLYRTVMEKKPSRNVGDTLPVDSVRYEDAALFCKHLSLLVGRTVQLPDEKAFKAAVGSVDAHAQTLASESWDSSNSEYKAHSVGTKSPNSHGFLIFWVMSLSGCA